MKAVQKVQLEEIIDGLKCPKEFICYTSGFEQLCKVKDIGIESFLVCLEGDSLTCKFSVHFGGLYFCQCPPRIYVCRELKK